MNISASKKSGSSLFLGEKGWLDLEESIKDILRERKAVLLDERSSPVISVHYMRNIQHECPFSLTAFSNTGCDRKQQQGYKRRAPTL